MAITEISEGSRRPITGTCKPVRKVTSIQPGSQRQVHRAERG